MKKLVLTLTRAALVVAPMQPAFAQAWIGQVVGDMMAQQAAAEERHRCNMGDPVIAAEVAEALAPTNAAMQAYFAGMQSGSAALVQFMSENVIR